MSSGRPVVDPAVIGALRFQQAGVAQPSLASPLYEALLGAVLADIDDGGPCAAVLAQVPAGLDPIADAVALRFLGAVHRLVLRGEAPSLARWFPTAGGDFDPAVDGGAAGADLVATVDEHASTLVDGLEVGVQTNEVGRCATLAVGFTEVLRSHGLPLRLLELGSSAGLNLRWDRWRYESGGTTWGDPGAVLRFSSNYRSPEPDVSAPIGPGHAVAERRGCDRSPIDATTDEGRLLLRSFVWPDQADRHARLDAALAAAADQPVAVEGSDAAEWLAARLAEPVEGTATVVFHSIVWQYLPAATREGILAALDAGGRNASAAAPLAWLRMEPGDDPSRAAEVRLRTWPGGGERLLARTGYHGHPVWAAGP
jgi:hypothetical protein